MELVEPVRINIYESSSYKKDLSWLNFHDEPRVQDRQQVKDHQSYISIFVAYLTLPSSSWEPQPDMTWQNDMTWQTWQQYFMQGHAVDLQRYRATSGERNFIEWIKIQIFLEAVLATEIMQNLQFYLEEKVNPSILKDDSSRKE